MLCLDIDSDLLPDILTFCRPGVTRAPRRSLLPRGADLNATTAVAVATRSNAPAAAVFFDGVTLDVYAAE